MTAIVLAGGRSRRMKEDKAGLNVGGKTLLERVLSQVGPYFDEVLVSVSPGQKPAYAVAAAIPRRPESETRSDGSPPAPRSVEDEAPGLGPLGGILSALKSAANEACAVVACDIPEIDVGFLRSLARAAKDFDIAVPVGPSGLREPLFAVYRKTIIPEIESLLKTGERSILPLYRTCRTAVVRFDDPGRIRNLNTRADYSAYLRSISGQTKGGSGGQAGRRGKHPSKGKI
jgi:molybdopterin-guanine dinucleotide biosynthesis protein A